MSTSEDCVDTRTRQCGWHGSPYMWANGSLWSWSPATSHVPVKPEVSIGNGDQLPEVDWKFFQNSKWPQHTTGQSQTVSNNNDNTNERESLPVQLIAVTTGVSGTNEHPTEACFESRW